MKKWFPLWLLAMGAGVLLSSLLLLLGSPPVTAAYGKLSPSGKNLPSLWLSDPDTADAPYGSSPTVDGRISPGEYAGAAKVTFPGYGGDVEVFFKQDGITLYVAFELPDKVNKNPWPNVSIYVDTDKDGGSNPQTDDFRFSVTRNGSRSEWQGTGGTWNPNSTVTWTYALAETASGWSVEFAIPLSKLGIVSDTTRTLGLALYNGGLSPEYYWPTGATGATPDTWGSLASSSNWSTFYWKPGPWQDYAPSGMPDFDQKQDNWQKNGQWTHCGPVAAADSLWWFDSKFETPDHPPPTISDTYRLITGYGPWDDHYISNVIPLVDNLAWYFDTDGKRSGADITGTNIISMFLGLHEYLRNHGLWDDYLVTLVVSPTFEWVASEVMRSEDVILLLGFYEWQGSQWVRVGGHYVNVAGVDPTNQTIAFSDPFLDNAEQGGPGRVLSGTLLTHYPPHPINPETAVHNDAGNVSHDIYTVTATTSPGGVWGPYGYPPALEPWSFLGANPHPWILNGSWNGSPTQVEVEFALSVSPFKWKASGHWDEGQGEWVPFVDYAPNGLPDFDQRQDNWKNQGTGAWSFCGPAAAANSLWWFDSKFEPSPTAPITYDDNYSLVQSYASMPSPWDDHDPLNVDNPGTPWPPSPWPGGPPMPAGKGEFIEDLALYFDTDGMVSGGGAPVRSGTLVTDVYQGIENYLTDHNLRQGYVITKVQKPDFWWVAEEVERSEDVILLLGFYQQQGGSWVRLGGHYVTLPGVDKQGGLVAFSDPFFDRAESSWPYAHPGGYPYWLGRVAGGWIIPHIPIPGHPFTTHNDAGNVSHDVYFVASTDSPGGTWGPETYVENVSDIDNFLGQNGGQTGSPNASLPVTTEVEWAVSLSPVADVWVTKTVTPGVITSGQWVTFVIRFGNAGSLPAEGVVISDLLPAELVNARYTYTLNYPGTLVGHDTFTWTVGTLGWNQGGIITVTARISPTLGDVQRIITNTVAITTTSTEQYQVPPLPNTSSVTFTVQTADVAVTKTARPADLVPGSSVTYTIVYTNSGPATAMGVFITDILPSELVSAAYSYANDYGFAITHTDRYVWNVGNIPAHRGGIITVTAKVSADLTHSVAITNRVTAETADRDASDNQAATSQSLCIPPAGASFTHTPTIPVVGKVITFTGSVTVGDPPPSYKWDFADGTGNGNPITHTYANPGNYTVWMTATNACGQDAYSKTLSVCQPVNNVGFQYSPADPWVGQRVFFTATASGSAPINYTWAADDGWTAAGVTANHAFASFGDHTVWLTATNACGQDTKDKVILVLGRQFELGPKYATAEGEPGGIVTYTLVISNTGNTADSYRITGTVSGEPWATYWPGWIGLVGGGLTASFHITVQIPADGVDDGDWSRVEITATSQGNPALSDTSVITTTVRIPRHYIYLPVVLKG